MPPLADIVIRREGRPIETPDTLEDAYAALGRDPGVVWIALDEPDDAELASVATRFGLHPLAVDDALSGHQRPKIDRYGGTVFVVLRPATYDDQRETVEFGELHVFCGADFVITIRHAGSPSLAGIRARIDADPDLLALGPAAVLAAIIDQVVDDYEPVVAGIENDIDEIEDDLFGISDDAALTRRMYQLFREVIGFHRAVSPLPEMIETLHRDPGEDPAHLEVHRSLRSVRDHAIRVTERAEGFRAVLDKALTVHTALVAQRQTEVNLAQNDQVKKISAWAAIIFAPTLIGTIYGMNFDVMPELHWEYGYPLALATMLVFPAVLFVIFRRRKWL